MEKIEVFELVIDTDDESGVTAIALVDQPAIESNWMAFSQQTEYKFNIKDEEKRIIEGYFMIADLLIPRIDENGKKFFVKFSSNTIEAIREKMSKNSMTNNFNLMHDPRQIAEGVFMLDNLIIDNKRGKVAPKEFEKVPDGSLWGSAKVDNDTIWEQVKSGEFRGFSVEGMFKQLEPVKVSESVIQKINDKINEFEKTIKESVQVNDKKTIESMSMKVIEDLKAILFKEETVVAETTETVETTETSEEVVVNKFMSAELANGTVINVEPSLEEGAMVTVEVDGVVSPIPDGDYVLMDGVAISVMGGSITAVKEVEAEEEEAMETEATPKAETETEQRIRKIIESTETVFSKVESLETELATIKEDFAKYKLTVEENNKAIFNAVEVIAEEPSTKPIVTKKSSFMAKPKSWQERLAEKKKTQTNNNK